MNLRVASILALLLLVVPAALIAQASITSTPLAEKRLAQLPSDTLVWRLESFPDTAAAEAAASEASLVVESSGQVWLATLDAAGGATDGGTLVAETGPMSVPSASEYLLRVVELSGPPGSQAGAHTHPGAEAYYVVSGRLTVRSQSGDASAGAGQTMIGPAAGMVMQPMSTGSEPLVALALFAVDANQPFSSPGAFETPGLPNTGAGGTSSDSNRLTLVIAALSTLTITIGGLALRRHHASL